MLHTVGLLKSLPMSHTMSLFKVCLSLSAIVTQSLAHQVQLAECHQHKGMDFCPVCDQMTQGPLGGHSRRPDREAAVKFTVSISHFISGLERLGPLEPFRLVPPRPTSAGWV